MFTLLDSGDLYIPLHFHEFCSGCSYVTWKKRDTFGSCFYDLLGGSADSPGESGMQPQDPCRP